MAFNREDLQRSVRSTLVPAYVTDSDGAIVAWNAAAEATLGHSRADVLGRPCHRVIGGRDDLGNHVCRVDCPVKRRAEQGRAVRDFRMHVRAEAGHYVEVQCFSLWVRGEAEETLIFHLLQTWPGGPRPRPRPVGNPETAPPGERLTDRETEVLQLLAAGLQTRELAAKLSISVATVRSHVENILSKLQARNRLEAVVKAMRQGLV